MQIGADPIVKKRNMGVAGIFSLLIPGLGQVYNAQPKKGLLFFAIALLLPFVLLCTNLALSFKSLLLVVALIIGYRL
jgi:TM2 domain-containing membrane protein YozV